MTVPSSRAAETARPFFEYWTVDHRPPTSANAVAALSAARRSSATLRAPEAAAAGARSRSSTSRNNAPKKSHCGILRDPGALVPGVVAVSNAPGSKTCVAAIFRAPTAPRPVDAAATPPSLTVTARTPA